MLADELAEDYKAMGQDTQREHEALVWSEALIGDSQEGSTHEAQ